MAQRMRRTRPSSLLARKVIVTEGKTEYGLLLECLQVWDAENSPLGLPTSAGQGVAIQDGGGGSEVAPRVQALVQLGYRVAGLLDNDDPSIDGAVMEASKSGALIVRWRTANCIEQEVCSGLQTRGLTEFLRLAVDLRGSEATVIHELNKSDSTVKISTLDVGNWAAASIPFEEARRRVSTAAIAGKWFKTVNPK